MPESVVTRTTEQLIDAQSYLINEPQRLARVYERHGAQYNNFFNWLRLQNRMYPNKGQTWRHYEKGWLRTPVHVLSAVTDPGVGNSTTFTLSPEDLDANGNYPLEDYGTTLLNPNTLKEMRVEGIDSTTNPAAPVVTISPMDGTSNIGALAAGTTLIVLSNAYAGGSGMPQGKASFPTERDYSMRLFKGAQRIEGHMIGKEQYYRRFDKSGALDGIWDENLFDMTHELDKDIALAFWIGDEVTNPSMVVSAAEAAYLDGSSNTGNRIISTKGLIQHITERGDRNSIPIGTEAYSDWETANIYLKNEGVNAMAVDWFMGLERKQKINEFLRTNNLQSTDFTTKMIEQYHGESFPYFKHAFGFDGVEIGGFNHMFYMVDEFDDSRSLNAPGYNFSRWAVGMPRSEVKDFNPDGDEIMSNLSCRYYSNKGYSRRDETFTLGGAHVNIYTSPIDEKGYYILRNLGLDVLYANQGLIWTG